MMSESVDVVTFNADRSLYAVPVSRVQEILDLRPVAAMPNAPAHLVGIMWLAYGNGRVIIGIKTDRVIEVTALDEPELRPLEEAELLRWSGSAIAGIGRRKGDVVSVLDLDRLFDRVELTTALAGVDDLEAVA
jgi:purine-binding chemotaxis protein CheW